jgi:GNAT superfamily N-acetyltransferase
VIRRFDPARDSVPALTRLLHRAYAPLAAQGLHFVATDQTDDVTVSRLARGECWVVEADGRIVACVTIHPPGANDDCRYYRRPGVASLHQLAVDPDHQGQGLSRRLLEHACERAVELGASELALDTAEPATRLVELYERRGFAIVDRWSWPETNYRSVVMSRSVGS